MLRIRVEDQPEVTTLYVEGKLAGDCVDELRKVWATVRTGSPDKDTVVDLCCVRTVDVTGRNLLRQMHAWGTRLAGNGLCIRHLIEEITNPAAIPKAE